ncbi:MAG: tyrosine-type recombinase/integrase [Sideroxyarcus sp.]|nr:tyrosine-type recombinase/integrase [Sideroxyarcus sp.]
MTFLNDAQLRALKPRVRAYKVSCGDNLYLLVNPSGSKLWRHNFKDRCKQKTRALGVYPAVGLAKARQLVYAYRLSPVAAAPAFSLQEVFADFLRVRKSDCTLKHQHLIVSRCAPVLDALGGRSINELRPADFLPLLRVIESRTQSVAKKVRTDFAQVYDYAIAAGMTDVNPVRSLVGALKPVRTVHRPALLDSVEIGLLLRFIDTHPTVGVVARAYLQVLPHIFVRPGELRAARWCDVDLDAGRWSYKMSKVGTDHIVPLSHQVVARLRALHVFTGDRECVFASVPSDSPLSDMTATQVLRRSGWSKVHSLHGWRATARTLLVEHLRCPVDIVEHQLGHCVRDALGRAYNRTQFLDDRKVMMQDWSDYLSSLCK